MTPDPRILAVLGVLALVGGVAWVTQANEPDCPGHWHSAFLVFVDGNQLHFNLPIFEDTRDSVHDHHMHGDDQVMHYHPQLRDKCIPLEDFLRQTGIRIDGDGLDLNEYWGGNQGHYGVGGNRTLEVHFAPHGGPWRQVDWNDVSDRQPRPGDRFLVTVGELDPGRVAWQLGQVRDLPDHYLPPSLRTNVTS